MSDAASDPQSAFWNFSLRFYAGAGIPAACLQLQDACGIDVNVMLYALFLARSGRLLRAQDIARIEALVADWRDNVVRPLRQARRFMKIPPAPFDNACTAALRTDVKRIELEAERLQQICLERNLPAHSLGTAQPDLRTCARNNLAACAHRLPVLPDGPVEVLLRRLHDT